MILLIDNYDSFTFNLVQYLSPFADVVVKRNDALDLKESAEKVEAIVLSPGPGKPNEAGKMEEIISAYYQTKPILGICLGHQGIAEVFGGKVSRANTVRHGKTSTMAILTTDDPLMLNLPQSLQVMRYHSLIVEQRSLPVVFNVLGVATDDQGIMAIKHRDYPVYGLQFHPESIGTVGGQQLVENFVNLVKEN